MSQLNSSEEFSTIGKNGTFRRRSFFIAIAVELGYVKSEYT